MEDMSSLVLAFWKYMFSVIMSTHSFQSSASNANSSGVIFSSRASLASFCSSFAYHGISGLTNLALALLLRPLFLSFGSTGSVEVTVARGPPFMESACSSSASRATSISSSDWPNKPNRPLRFLDIVASPLNEPPSVPRAVDLPSLDDFSDSLIVPSSSESIDSSVGTTVWLPGLLWLWLPGLRLLLLGLLLDGRGDLLSDLLSGRGEIEGCGLLLPSCGCSSQLSAESESLSSRDSSSHSARGSKPDTPSPLFLRCPDSTPIPAPPERPVSIECSSPWPRCFTMASSSGSGGNSTSLGTHFASP
mmetsp:Transcript_28809/g.63945  ORF Transcript_28809/g.63945 Transcript_28809/m.63945 type:complete len:305 (-) Transcript_28809:2126-3040(-)